jgi:hypothetical protein
MAKYAETRSDIVKRFRKEITSFKGFTILKIFLHLWGFTKDFR